MTYYELLGVQPTASPEEVHRAYRRAIRRYHPDVNKAPNAAQVTMRLNEAWATLANGSSRTAYDRSLRVRDAEFHPEVWEPRGAWEPHPQSAWAPHQQTTWQPPPGSGWQQYHPGPYVPYQVSPGYRFASVVYGGLCFVALFAFIASALHWLPVVASIFGAVVVARLFSRALR